MTKRKANGDTATDEAVKQFAALVDGFCKQHLNGAYADLWRKYIPERSQASD